MRRLAATVLVFALALGSLPARSSAEDDHHAVNLTLFYPVGTNRNPDISTNFRLSLVYGLVGSVRGLDLNAVVGRTKGDVYGVQLNGVYSQTEGELRGIQLTAGVNYLRGDGRGLQYGGLVNYDRGRFVGIQWSALFNYTEGGFSGLQWTSLFNLNESDGRILQISGLANAVGGSFRGVQIAALVNFAGERLRGVQLGGVNFVPEIRGLQVGGANFAKDAHGVQIGALNMVREHHGVPIGLVSFADNGTVDWVTYASNLAAVNTGIRTTVNHFYSMLTVGFGDLQGEVENAAFLSWHFGREIPAGRSIRFGVDLGYNHIMPENSATTDADEPHWAVEARLLGEASVSSKLSLFAGGGISLIGEDYASDASTETEPLFLAGVSLF